jgi:hypothetical protein
MLHLNLLCSPQLRGAAFQDFRKALAQRCGWDFMNRIEGVMCAKRVVSPLSFGHILGRFRAVGTMETRPIDPAPSPAPPQRLGEIVLRIRLAQPRDHAGVFR